MTGCVKEVENYLCFMLFMPRAFLKRRDPLLTNCRFTMTLINTPFSDYTQNRACFGWRGKNTEIQLCDTAMCEHQEWLVPVDRPQGDSVKTLALKTLKAPMRIGWLTGCVMPQRTKMFRKADPNSVEEKLFEPWSHEHELPHQLMSQMRPGCFSAWLLLSCVCRVWELQGPPKPFVSGKRIFPKHPQRVMLRSTSGGVEAGTPPRASILQGHSGWLSLRKPSKERSS